MSESSVISTEDSGPKQERSRRTYEWILVAAEKLFIESGWDDLTTNAVAEAAGISIGSLYRYFPDKAAVVRALAARAAAPALARLDALLAEPRLDGELVLKRMFPAGEGERPEGSLCLSRLQGPRCSDELGEISAAIEAEMEGRLARLVARLQPGIEADRALARAKLLRGLAGVAAAQAEREPGLEPLILEETLKLLRGYFGS
jgi:AcrR family transcriptional regulator